MGRKFIRRRGRPSFRSNRPHDPWTLQEIDICLTNAIGCRNRSNYLKTCKDTGKTINRGEVDRRGVVSYTYHPVDTILWKLASGYARFRAYRPGRQRVDRSGKPLSYLDEKILHWAFDPTLDGQKIRITPPDDEFVSRLLKRRVSEVKKFHTRILANKKGFGLLK